MPAICNMLVLITHSFIHHITPHTTTYHTVPLLHELLILVACITIPPIHSAKVPSIVNLVIHPSLPFLSSSTSSWPPPKQQPDYSHSSNARTNSSRPSSRHNIVTGPFKQARCYDHGQCRTSTCSHKDS